MTKQLKDKVAIVTGASSGIGRGIAEAFAAEGAKTVIAARRKAVLDEMAAAIRAAGGEVLAAPTDVTKEAEVAALFAKTREAYGRVDIVVNNAGVAAGRPIDEMTLEYWNDVVDVNLTAAFLVSREAVKTMKAQSPQGGRIINMGSVSAKTPRPDSIAYTATKFAIHGMTHQLTMDGRKYGVVASVIHPGATLSSFSARRGRTAAGAGATPQDYIMAANDVARVAVLMCALPPEVNLYEATILPNQMPSFIGRG
ncbi:MAG TPA: SDR family oxidoreductase [Alphaproteobacteria bacterium]|nr:SDR family oxidoreductase [Alphaproteobacteria bacterium]